MGGPISWDTFSGLPDIYFLFTDLVYFFNIIGKWHNFGNTFLRYYLSETIDIWYEASVGGPISWDTFSGLPDIYFLFTDLVNFFNI